TLPGGIEDLGDGGLEALMGVRDHELDASEAAAGEAAQEVGPERLGFGSADRHAEDLAATVAIDAVGDDHRDRDDPAVATYLHVGRIEPDIGPLAPHPELVEGRAAD